MKSPRAITFTTFTYKATLPVVFIKFHYSPSVNRHKSATTHPAFSKHLISILITEGKIISEHKFSYTQIGFETPDNAPVLSAPPTVLGATLSQIPSSQKTNPKNNLLITPGNKSARQNYYLFPLSSRRARAEPDRVNFNYAKIT